MVIDKDGRLEALDQALTFSAVMAACLALSPEPVIIKSVGLK